MALNLTNTFGNDCELPSEYWKMFYFGVKIVIAL